MVMLMVGAVLRFPGTGREEGGHVSVAAPGRSCPLQGQWLLPAPCTPSP